MARTPDHLTFTVSWDHPGLREAIETIIAKAWAEGFRSGVNAERKGEGPFGSDALTERYRDWRGYGPGVDMPGGAIARAIILSADQAKKMQEAAPVLNPSETEAGRRLLAQLNTEVICIIHKGPWPCAHSSMVSTERSCVRGTLTPARRSSARQGNTLDCGHYVYEGESVFRNDGKQLCRDCYERMDDPS